MHELTEAAVAVALEAGVNNGRAMEFMLGLPEAEAKQVAKESIEVALVEAMLAAHADGFGQALYLLKLGIALGIAAERRTAEIASRP